ncbi:glycoside hydrolase family 38 N-terminal domain-containing protein [Microlunatus soli]|uniref:Glycosyl hydrolases family 38 N-terminal domain-containing protein n=1 Tax=Microlunatus soli TaxID=630515 RepID=A0A1H1TTZ4_9ACTN|nr:alpha-mannosidase [Microlunatus soli]SDS63672.1 Glycosyl hydrolases family 38 N-terminal domain-containing protein [Microlunatus soli]
MTTKALIKDHPWSSEKARAGTVAQAVAATAELGELTVRVIPEHLVRRGDQGRERTLRVLIERDGAPVSGAHGAGWSYTLRSGADQLPVHAEPGPADTVRLFTPVADQANPVTLTVANAGTSADLEFVLEPPRDWTIHLVHHSHLDIGYTDPQGVVLGEHVSFLDSCLDLTGSTDDWEDDAKFRWAVESLWSFEQWAAARPEHRVQQLIDRVKEGRVELTAMPYNLHTDTCSTDELHELLRLAQRVEKKYGVKLKSAMQTDVPGTVAGLPDALAALDIRYLSVAHNWAGRSVPQLVGGQHLPRLFRWRSPAGNEVLVWMTDSPHGLAYMEGPVLGFDTSYDMVDDLLPAYLTSMATNPYPFPPGMFGWHGPAVEDREPYPWDILHLRVQGHFGDNAPPRLILAETVKQWNETWESPRIRLSTNADFFEDAEARLGDQIQTFEGDWGDWWVEGVGSGARQQAMVRQAQASVNSSQSAYGLAAAGRPAEPSNTAGRVDTEASQVYHFVSLFNEHTWGAANSWTHSDAGMNSGSQQEIWKFANAINGFDEAATMADHAASALGSVLPINPDATVSFWAVNPTAVPRASGTVRLFLRESRVPLNRLITVTDGRTGAELPFVETPQINPDHRDAGRFVDVRIADVPSFGQVRIDITQGDPVPPTDGAGGDLEWGADFFGRPSSANIPAPGTPAILENDHLRVEVDLAKVVIRSIIEKGTGRELVNSDAVVGFNGYVYDTYTTAGGYNHQANKTSVSEELELLGSRTLARPAALIEWVDDGVEQRLAYEWTADGVNRGWTMLRLGADDAHLVIDNRFDKPSTMTKESAYLSFPFAVDQPDVKYEITGAQTGSGLDHVPGAPRHMRAVRSFVTLTDDRGPVAWVTRDAPLVQSETIALPYAPFPDSTAPREPGTLYSWVHNNIWDTNFPAQQAFEATWRYAVGVRRADETDLDPAVLGVRTAAAVDQPLLGILAAGPADSTDAVRSLLSVDDPRVRVIAVRPIEGPDGRDDLQVRLQSYVDQPVTVAINLTSTPTAAWATTFLGDDHDQLEVAAAEDGASVSVSVPRLGAAAVRLRW